MGLKFTNFATSTIADVGGILAGDTTVNLSPGDGALFPSLSAGDYFYCTLIDSSANREVVKATARSTDTLTIVRAQDGTTARAFDQGDVIELRINKGALDEFAGAVSDISTHVAEASGKHFPIGTVMIFGQLSAPTGWTRKTNWTDNAMLCYAASGSILSGGSANPQSGHTHTGPSHTHTGPSHTHTGPNHTHNIASHIHSIASHALSLAEMPAHNHTYTQLSYYGTVSQAGYNRECYTSGTGSTGSAGSGQGHTHGGGVTGASGTLATGGGGTGATGSAGTGATGAGGTGATGTNTAPYYQEVIAATRDA